MILDFLDLRWVFAFVIVELLLLLGLEVQFMILDAIVRAIVNAG